MTKTWETHDDLCKLWDRDSNKVEVQIEAIFPCGTLKAFLEANDYQRIARMENIEPPKMVLPLFGESWLDQDGIGDAVATTGLGEPREPKSSLPAR